QLTTEAGRLVEPPAPNREEAATVLAKIRAELGMLPLRSMPAAPIIRRMDTIGLEKVYAIVPSTAQEIHDSLARCEALEATCEPGPVASAIAAPFAGTGQRGSVDESASG